MMRWFDAFGSGSFASRSVGESVHHDPIGDSKPIAFLGRARHLSKFVKHYFVGLEDAIRRVSTTFSQRFPHGYDSAQRGAALEERGQVRVFIVSNSVLPATKYDADPFESPGSHGLMVGMALTMLLLVVHARPLRLGDRMTRPFVKALP